MSGLESTERLQTAAHNNLLNVVPLHPHAEGVFNSEGVPAEIVGANERLAHQQLADPSLRSIGNMTVLDTKYTYDKRMPDHRREHLMTKVEVDNFEHRLWVTEPVLAVKDPLVIVAKPGLGEVIEDGVGFRFHTEIAKQLPETLVISHATHGVGSTADRIPIKELPKHGIDQMAEQGLKLLEAYCHDRRVVYVGTSMGTVIGNKLLNLNLDNGSPVNIQGVVHFAPALVTPEHVLKDMTLYFLPTLTRDIGRQLTVKTHPKHLIGTMVDLIKSKPSLRDIPPFARQIFDLLRGTSEEEIDRVLLAYDVAVINGTLDSVGGYTDLWPQKEGQYPGLTVHPVRGRGHDIATDPVRGGKKVAKTIVSRGWLPAEFAETA